jgi:hypothetical protein
MKNASQRWFNLAGFAERLARSAALLLLALAVGQVAATRMEAHAAQAPKPEPALIPPAWSQTLPAADRFALVMGNAAVLDKETGLVWQRSPGTTDVQWQPAWASCIADVTTGGRRGWRLPTIEELASLLDPAQEDPPLPAGHPFTNLDLNNTYWSITSNPGIPGDAVYVTGGQGTIGSRPKTDSTNFRAWCVRGGHGAIDGNP